MGYIHCCAGLHKTKSYVIVPTENFAACELDKLVKCPVCGHYVIQLTRIDKDNNITTVRYTNKKAKQFWEKIKSKILYERRIYNSKAVKGTFYLNYNEFGVKKRCYSNFSNLKIGLS